MTKTLKCTYGAGTLNQIEGRPMTKTHKCTYWAWTLNKIEGCSMTKTLIAVARTAIPYRELSIRARVLSPPPPPLPTPAFPPFPPLLPCLPSPLP
jgi:hypothetical protein